MLIEYKAHRDFSANRGRPRIAKGTTLYAIKQKNVFFVWSYLNKDFAEKIDAKLEGPKDASDQAWNWRYDLRSLNPSGRIKD